MTATHCRSPLTLRGWIVNVLGWLAVIVSLALISPGVVTRARAEPAAADAHAGAEAGPVCEAGARPEQAAVELEQAIAVLRAQLAAEAVEGDDEVVVLDGRGYNYAPTPPAPAPR